jgi:uncharacterized protein YecT (DUF1311 family)
MLSAKLIVCFLAFSLSGCGEVVSNTAGECGGTGAQSSLQDILEKNIAKAVPRLFDQDEFSRTISSVEIKREARKLVLTLEDSRTSDDRPNSTARLCRATAVLKLPSSMIERVETLMSASERGDLEKLVGSLDGELQGTSANFDIEYEVQPTDDATNVITESSTDQGLFEFATAFVALHLRSPEASEQIASAQREAAEEQATIVSAEREVAEATQNSEIAAKEEAQTESRLARQTLNAIWTNLDSDERQSLLELQRAWLKRKQADCNLESASASTDPELKATAYLKCDTRVSQERIKWLRVNTTPMADASLEDRD